MFGRNNLAGPALNYDVAYHCIAYALHARIIRPTEKAIFGAKGYRDDSGYPLSRAVWKITEVHVLD